MSKLYTNKKVKSAFISSKIVNCQLSAFGHFLEVFIRSYAPPKKFIPSWGLLEIYLQAPWHSATGDHDGDGNSNDDRDDNDDD